MTPAGAGLDPAMHEALLRLLPGVGASSASGALGLVALLLFARDRSRRDLLLYGLLASGVAISLLLRPPLPALLGLAGGAADRLREALSFALPAAGYAFALRVGHVPLGAGRGLLLVLPACGLLLALWPSPRLHPFVAPLAGVTLVALSADVLLALARPERRRRAESALLFVGTGSLLLLALLEGALSRGIVLLPRLDVPLLGAGFLLFSALLLVALADEGRRLLVRATTDPLTGVPNRATFLERARGELERAGRTGESLSVVMLDVDRFKSFNDRYGHQTGDRVLVAVAQAIQVTIRGIDLVGRFGGEEFVLLLVDVDEKSAVAAIERVRRAISSLGPPRVPQRITASAGAVVHHGRFDRASVSDLIAAADTALYRSKESGRDRTTLAVAGEEKPTSAAEVRYR